MFRRLIGYAFYMLGAGALTSALSFIVDATGMISRPKEAYGDYHVYLLIASIGMSLFVSGVNGTIQKFGAGNDDNRLRLGALTLRIFAAIAVVGVLLGVVVGMVYRWSLSLGFIVFPWIAIFWWGRYLFRSQLDPRLEARLLVAASLSKSVLIGGFLAFSDLRDAMIYGDALAVMITGAVSLHFYPQAFGASLTEIWRTKVGRPFAREVFMFTRPLWLGGQVFAGRSELVGIFTTSYFGPAAMAAIGSTRQLWGFAFKPMDFFAQASLPGLVSEAGSRLLLFRRILRISLVAFPILGVGLAALSPVLLDLMTLGHKYAEVPMMLVVLAASTPSIAVQTVLAQYAIAEGDPRFTLYSHLAELLVIGALILPSAHFFGLDGVVVAALFGAIGAAVCMFVAMWRDHGRAVRISIAWWTIANVGVLLALLPVALQRWTNDGWWSVAVAVPLLVATMLIGRLIRLNDVRRVRRIATGLWASRKDRRAADSEDG